MPVFGLSSAAITTDTQAGIIRRIICGAALVVILIVANSLYALFPRRRKEVAVIAIFVGFLLMLPGLWANASSDPTMRDAHGDLMLASLAGGAATLLVGGYVFKKIGRGD